jgi:pyridoxamine 5'-phosphate oxidase
LITSHSVVDDPLLRFQEDRRKARDAKDPMAAVCVLATVDEDGLPQARTLVLRDIAEGLAIYINASSPKWQQVQGVIALQTWWPSLQVQYRMQARCEELPATHIAESWQLRPDMPKHLDWLYEQIAQGSAVEDREDLLAQLDTAPRPEPLVAPPNARGLLLWPQSIERLDLNQTNGVHERRRYTLHADQWAVETLIP